MNELFDISFSDPSRAYGGCLSFVCCFPVCVLVLLTTDCLGDEEPEGGQFCVCAVMGRVVWCGP